MKNSQSVLSNKEIETPKNIINVFRSFYYGLYSVERMRNIKPLAMR
ncbi:hypothetical protein CNEO4_310032 [Clostridium neonatale]|nr:hypothetical protein CNEO4_310032 [Clostridium neonatale]